ncbi:hypothetical protein K2O51_33570 (plasmid) [Cupriavidus pinatubonensis]|uniref:hypothetical protein n=1 Tax=Cupriavidus pinatubonensis TaxID=248026 RepID=UPI001C736B3E|nr:hypothetical protein [Cupriavidus pinatubonensis]QYY33777.1 hypothetical protein K2O51_33570 [Cupriavidus pinatubonensis]
MNRPPRQRPAKPMRTTDKPSENYTKSAYLKLPLVDQFVHYLRRLLRGEELLHFEYSFPRAYAPANFHKQFGLKGLARTLQDLFDRYHWNKRDYAETAIELLRIQHALRESLYGGTIVPMTINELIGEVMYWGLPKPAAELNIAWAQKHGHRLPFALNDAILQLKAQQPDYDIFACDSSFVLNGAGRARMNAGFTKVYSLLLRGIIIYDGRVGAALCWLVRRFLVSIGHPGHVPDELAFLWSAGRGRQNRNPNGNGFTFDKLSVDGRAWAQANVRASWILEKARITSGATWCSGADELRKVECSLFMLGYRLPIEGGESGKSGGIVKKTARAKTRALPPSHIALVNTAGSFDINELEKLVREGQGYILIGSTHGRLSEDAPLETLEYWLRSKAGKRGDHASEPPALQQNHCNRTVPARETDMARAFTVEQCAGSRR